MEDDRIWSIDLKAVEKLCKKLDIEFSDRKLQRRIIHHKSKSGLADFYEVQQVKWHYSIPEWHGITYTDNKTLESKLARFDSLDVARAFMNDPTCFMIEDKNVVEKLIR